MIKGYKIVITAIVAGFIAAPSAVIADPITDVLDGVFKHPNAQVSTKNNKHTHQPAVQQPQQDNSWFPGQAFAGAGQRMIASFYGHGEKLSKYTASGQRFNPHGYTAAHRTLPFGTRLHVCHHGCVTVVVNDRGPFVRGRHLDLSYGAARAIGLTTTSTVHVSR